MYLLCYCCIEFEHPSSCPALPKAGLISAAPQDLPGETVKISFCLLQGKIMSDGEVKNRLGRA